MEHALKTSELVEQAKANLGITRPNGELTDDDIRAIARWVGTQAPDTVCTDGEVTFNRTGIDLMLFITLAEFPEFYSRYELSQFN